jgi:hypothetical protein
MEPGPRADGGAPSGSATALPVAEPGRNIRDAQGAIGFQENLQHPSANGPGDMLPLRSLRDDLAILAPTDRVRGTLRHAGAVRTACLGPNRQTTTCALRPQTAAGGAQGAATSVGPIRQASNHARGSRAEFCQGV